MRVHPIRDLAPETLWSGGRGGGSGGRTSILQYVKKTCFYVDEVLHWRKRENGELRKMGQAQQKEFDALEYVKELREVGFKQEQAEVQARHLRLVKNDNLSNLATKEELKHETALLREELKHETALIRKDIEQLKNETRKDIEQLKNETKKDIEQLRIDGNHQIELVRKDIEQLRNDTMSIIKDIKDDMKETKKRVDNLSTKVGEQTNKAIYVLGTLVVVIATLFALFGKK